MATKTKYSGRSILNKLAASSFVIMAGASLTLAQQNPSTDSPQPDSERVRTVDIPLQDLLPFKGPLRLPSSETGADIVFPVSPLIEPVEASLRLKGAASLALNERSFLTTYLNGPVIGQVPLATQGNLNYTVQIDPASLKPGANRLFLGAVQHHDGLCELPDAPELWSEVDLDLSQLSFAYRRSDERLGVANLPALLQSGIGASNVYKFVTASAPTRAEATAIALMAQSIGIRRNDGLPEFRHGFTRREDDVVSIEQRFVPNLDNSVTDGVNTVLVGTIDKLRDFLSTDLVAQVDKGLIALTQNRGGTPGFILIITGKTEADIIMAANAAAFSARPVNDTDIMPIDRVEATAGGLQRPSRTLVEGKEHELSSIGFRTVSVVGADINPINIDFRIPADTYLKGEETAEVNLDFSYGAGLALASTANVYVNDILVGAALLNSPTGASIDGYNIPFPVNRFKPGNNRIAIEPVLKLDVDDPCARIDERNLTFALRNTSTIKLPGLDQYVELPDLSLMSDTGYPYDDDGWTLEIADTNPETLAAGWTLLSKMSQASGRIPAGLKFDGLSGNAPASPNDISDVSHRIVVGVRSELAQGDELSAARLGELTMVAQSNVVNPQTTILEDTVRVWHTASLGRNGLVFGFKNDLDGLTTVFSAETPSILRQRVQELSGSALWAQIAGDLGAWRGEDHSFVTQPAGETLKVGSISPTNNLLSITRDKPFMWTSIILIILAIFAALSYFTIGSMRRKRLESEAE